MRIEYRICDRCAASIPENTGASVIRFGAYPLMHLCEKCCEETFIKPEQTMDAAKRLRDEAPDDAGAEQNPGGEA